MEYSKIISVTGMGGLFELVGSKADGAIVRSLDDNSVKFASSRVHNFSHLESIEVYTIRENVTLTAIFDAIEKSPEKLPSEKDAAAVKAYFQKVYPDMDFDRVYGSDMKKMVKWYTIIKNNNIDFRAVAAPVEEEATTVEDVKEETPKKKAAPKKAKEEAVVGEDAAEEKKPVKKAAPKKKATEDDATEEKEAAPKKKAATKKAKPE